LTCRIQQAEVQKLKLCIILQTNVIIWFKPNKQFAWILVALLSFFFFTFEVSGCDYFFEFVVMTDVVGISGQIVPSSFWETKVVAIVKGISVQNVHLLYVSDNLPWAFRCHIEC
jgi:hypothetical protein